jgi:uncharacterized protein YecE (DUF72 family)
VPGPAKVKAKRMVNSLPMAKRRGIESSRQASLFRTDEYAAPLPKALPLVREFDHPRFLLGTSAFTAAGWAGSFYPEGMNSDDYLAYYASKFRTVEIDSTYYGTPAASTVESWYRKTPADFIFAAKVPQIVTHTNLLLNCEAEFDEFVGRMTLLKEKLGPLLFQFPRFSQFEFKGPGPLLSRLRIFLRRATRAYKCRFAVEIRNKTWLDAELIDLLGEHRVALALTDHSFMPRPWEYKQKFNPITADFTYIRWLVDRKGIEELTRTWDKIIMDRKDDLRKWAEVFRQFSDTIQVYAYANNHYAGNGPKTINLFWKLLTEPKV